MTQTPEDPSDFDPLWQRLLWMIIVAVLLSMAQTLLWLITIAQFIVMAVNQRAPNEQLQEIGTTLGLWMAKSVHYLTAASEVKPWPWTRLD